MRRAWLAVCLMVAGCSGQVKASAPADDAGVAVDGARRGVDASVSTDAASFSGPLPACHWPADLNPSVPDGAFAGWSVSRTYLVCGSCTMEPGGGCAFGGSDSGTSLGMNATVNGDTACIMGCRPDQYAVTAYEPFPGGPGGTPDADVVEPNVPAGCTGTQPAVTAIIARTGFAEGAPQVTCCSCE